MKRILNVCLAAVLPLFLFAASAEAGSISLAWDPNTEADLAGYIVSYGTSPGRVDGTADVGNRTAWTFTTGTPGQTYYFRLRAYSTTRSMSAQSAEVSAMVDGTPAPPAVGPVPFGFVDSPTDNAAGVTGSIGITGWALDDALVTRVRIFRDAVAGEAAGTLVYIGDGSFVDGARPDLAAAYAGLPASTRAGWGYLMLTNFLPNQGNGTFTLRAYAEDADGHSTLLGTKTITCTNSTSTTPFGAIDTPRQGETVSGTINIFGWVLSRGFRRADPPGGGTVRVVIDGVSVGSPVGWTSRSDLSSFFSAVTHSGILWSLGVLALDTRTLTNGVHTVAWAVTDNSGAAAGVGSRYFTVANAAPATAAPLSATMATREAATVRTAPTSLQGRRGFDLEGPFRTYQYDADGLAVVQAEELDRIELRTDASEGYLTTASGVQPLPFGARLDANGVFTWQPGVAFLGTYDFVFVGAAGAKRVRVVLNPKGTGRVGPQVVIDTPSHEAHGTSRPFDAPFVVAGWAADLDADVDSGIDTIHVWAYPVTGAGPVFLGTASLGGARPDVAAVYGERFRHSGYGINVSGLAPGGYDVAVFAWSTVTGGFVPAKTVRVHVR